MTFRDLPSADQKLRDRELECAEQAFLDGGRPPTCGHACERSLQWCPCFKAFCRDRRFSQERRQAGRAGR